MIADVLAEATSRMDRAVEAAKDDFATVRTGRANPQMFQQLLVEYYGSPTPLQQLASLANPEARTLLVTPYDKTALGAIEEAIRNMPNLGANPTNDGTVVRLTLPDLTEERRKEYVKLVRGKAEDARVRVRGIRRQVKDELTALKDEIGEDDVARGEKELDTLTKKHVDLIDEALGHKESELLEI